MWRWLRALIEPSPEANYVAQVQAWESNPECPIPPLALPAIKPLEAKAVPADWTWSAERRRYVPPVKVKRPKKQQNISVVPMRKQG